MAKIDYRYRLAVSEKEELKAMINVFRLQEFEDTKSFESPMETALNGIINHINVMIQEAFDTGLKEGRKRGDDS